MNENLYPSGSGSQVDARPSVSLRKLVEDSHAFQVKVNLPPTFALGSGLSTSSSYSRLTFGVWVSEDRRNWILMTSGHCKQYNLPRTRFSHAQFVLSLTPRTDSTHRVAQESRSTFLSHFIA